MNILDATIIDPAPTASDGHDGNHKKKTKDGRKKGHCLGGRSGEARKISRLVASHVQNLALDEARLEKLLERIWILLRISNADAVLADSRKITDADREFLIETGGPKTLLKGGTSSV